MHSIKHATAAAEWATCIYSDSDHAHVATVQPVQPMLYGQAQPMMAQNIMVCSKQRQRCCNNWIGDGILAIQPSFSDSFRSCVSSSGQLVVRSSRCYLRTHWGSQGSKTGVGGGQGVAGLVLGYLTLAGYLLPFLLLGSIGAGASI